MDLGDFKELRNYDWQGRLMFGSDLLVWQAGDETGLTSRYRAYAKALRDSGLLDTAEEAFAGFLLPGWSTLKPSSPNEMKKNLVKKNWMFPMPVLMIGTYGEDGKKPGTVTSWS